MKTTKLHWTELIVTDVDGTPMGTLGEYVDQAEGALTCTLATDGSIESWQGVNISAPDEDPDWDTPRCPVDWVGFEAAAMALAESYA